MTRREAMPSLSAYTLPSAKPAPFSLPPGRTALIIIDMQRDFIMKGGYGYLQCNSDEVFDQVSKIIEPCKNLLQTARKLGLTIIHTREGHQPDLSDLAPSKLLRQSNNKSSNYPKLIGDEGPLGKLLVRGEYGHDIIDELRPFRNEIVIDKPGKGTFYNTDIHQILVDRGITHLLICGVTTECCVATTFREANDHGFDCCILSDCTGGFNGPIVTETLNVAYAYDGLLGSIGVSIDLTNLLAAKGVGLLGPGSVLPKDSLLFDGYEYMMGDDVVGASVTYKLKTNGAKLVEYWSEKGKKSIHISVDNGCAEKLESSFRFSASNGMLPLTGIKSKTTISTISIKSSSIKNIKYVHANLRSFDEEDCYSKQPNEFYMYPSDYRGVEIGGFKYSIDDISTFDPKNGTLVKLHDKLIDELLNKLYQLSIYGSNSLGCGIGPIGLEMISNFPNFPSLKPNGLEYGEMVKYGYVLNEFNELKRKIGLAFKSIDIFIMPLLDSESKQKVTKESIVPRILGYPTVSIKSKRLLVIGKPGTDGRLLDIVQHLCN